MGRDHFLTSSIASISKVAAQHNAITRLTATTLSEIVMANVIW
jgi:hypothetical protein